MDIQQRSSDTGMMKSREEAASVSGWMAVVKIAAIFLLSRITILIAGYYTNPRIEKFIYYQKQGHFTDPFFQWDAYWYLGIIKNGYYYQPGEPSNVHFFPLYPLIVRFCSWLFHDVILTGFIVSNLALFAAVYVLYKLVKLDGKSEESAELTALYACIFPTSFFLSLFYPESLYLLLSLATLYLARQGKWAWASLCGGLLALTKTPGIIILGPVTMEYLGINRGSIMPWRWKKPSWDILWLGLIPLGLIVYMIYLNQAFGDPFAFSKATAAWSRKIVPINETFGHSVRYHPFERYLYYGTVALALISLVAGFFARIRLSYLAYGSVLLTLFVSSHVLESIQRHVLMIFPIYMVLGLLGARSRFANLAIVLISVMLLTVYTVVFVAGYRMY